MTSIAVIVSVSSYDSDVNNLPGCHNDGTAMNELITQIGRFDEILFINKDTTSANFKIKISDYVEKYKEKSVDEFLFYFTGHGMFDGLDFYYLLSDYNPRRKNQTSMSNDELDRLVRALNPGIFIKVVDACQSGMNYIKNPEALNEYLKGPNPSFGKIYFLFSSQNDQSSYQNDDISFFTESFLKSILSHTQAEIRYKDIISFISDDFDEHGIQKPHFVTQADFTEKFCRVTDDLKNSLRRFIDSNKNSDETKKPNTDEFTDIIANISADAERYCDKEEAFENIEFLYKTINETKLTDSLKKIYDIIISKENEYPINSAPIGEWLENFDTQRSYFAKATTRREQYKKRVLKNPLQSISSISSLFLSEDDYTYIDSTRDRIDGYHLTTTLPFKHLTIYLKPKLPNLTPTTMYIAPIISRTSVRVFSSMVQFEHNDWESTYPKTPFEWETNEFPIKDRVAAEEYMNTLTSEFISSIMENLRRKWGAARDNTIHGSEGE